MHALALRSSLLVDALDARGLDAACRSAADAVTVDLASPGAYAGRANARRAANHALLAVAATGRPVQVRVSDVRSGETEGDVMSTVRAGLTAVVLTATERPQDVRDIDVMVRRQEMRRDLEPGGVRLIPEVASAAGLRALPAVLDATDRHSAVTLDVTALAADLRLPGAAAAHLGLLEHAMAEVALSCAAAGVAWTLAAPGVDAATRSALATRAHVHGAAGVVVSAEAEAQGFNRLFRPDENALQAARLVLAEWKTLRARDAESGEVAGHLVDRRTMRHARVTIARAEAIAARERVR